MAINIETNLQKAALFIFLNKTCFNGLYRVNRYEEFNVAIGDYDTPIICDEQNLLQVSKKLQKVEIVYMDYHNCCSFVDENTFVYLDPPYLPTTKTSSSISYTIETFGIKEQIELANFFHDLNFANAKLLMSNSNISNNFFETLYENYNIKYTTTFRSINCNVYGRGRANEILISNF